MLNRIILYITKNFGKMISTLIMFTVMLSLLATLTYTFATVNNRVDDGGVIRSNYIIDEEKVFNADDSSNNAKYESYTLLFDEMLSLDGLEAYKVDTGYNLSSIIADGGVMLDEIDNKMLNIQIANDEKQMDFFSNKVEIAEGDFSEDGIIVSREMAEEYGITVGDEVNISSLNFLYEDMIAEGSGETVSSSIDATAPLTIKDDKKYPIKVSGIYEYIKEENTTGHTVYMSYEKTQDYNEFVKEKEVDLGTEYAEYSERYPDFERVMAQYDNKNSMKALDSFAKEHYDFIDVVDSSKIVSKSLEPLGDFKNLLLIASLIMIIISIIGIYLNMYLKLDKRRSEFIALLGFGVNSSKLSIQVFLEQLAFLILSIPFAYLIVNSLAKFVIEMVKRYFIILIEEQEAEAITGVFYEYVSVDPVSIVDFDYANIHIVIAISLGIITLSLLLLTIIEIGRRYRNIKKV